MILSNISGIDSGFTRDGRVASDGRTQLEEVMKLHSSRIDYNLQAKIHEGTVREKVMDDITEEDAGN